MTEEDNDHGSVWHRLYPRFMPDTHHPYEGFDEDWWDDERQRYKALGRTLYWSFVPHQHNHASRKIVTSILMLTWSAVTVGKAFGIAEAGEMYPYISILVFAIVCTIWGFELGMLNSTAGALTAKQEERKPPEDEIKR